MRTPPDMFTDTPALSHLPVELIVLMYHHCAEPPSDAAIPGLYVTPQQFAWQIDWLLNQGVTFCTFADLELGAAHQAGGPLVMLTFDDGFRDVYENAWPILAQRHVPAVVFPVVGDIGKSGVVWPENTDRNPQSLMNESQIREMAAGGIEFGSHLWDHRRASNLPLEELRTQLSRSQEALSRIVGRKTLSIAYPFGAYSPQVVAETGRAGYRYAVTTQEGSNRNASLLQLNRYSIRGTRFHHRWRFARTLRRALAKAA